MKRLSFVLVFISTFCLAQSKDSIADKYLEDQIYLSITYNILEDLPSGIKRRGLSNGISLGFIKDLPVNEERNFGFGIGLGYGRNTFYQNLKISEINNTTIFEEVQGDFKRNKFSLHTIELPIEIRWRTSTADKYKFWRVYSGIKLGYVFASNAKLKQSGTTTKVNGISEVEKFQYGLTLGAGYGTWNLNIYYGLSDIFSGAQLNNTDITFKLNDIRIGIIFYIL